MHSLREFTELAFEYAGMEIEWSGTGLSEVAVLKSNGRKVIEIDSTYFRPNLELVRWGDSGKAKKMLGWEASISFDDLVREMIMHELNTI
jgi:GDPmannose 4,6-dehydratase